MAFEKRRLQAETQILFCLVQSCISGVWFGLRRVARALCEQSFLACFDQALVRGVEFAREIRIEFEQPAVEDSGGDEIAGVRRPVIVVIQAGVLFAALDRLDEGVEGFDADDAGKTRKARSAADDGGEDSSGQRSGGREKEAGGDEDTNPEEDGSFPGCGAGPESNGGDRCGFGAPNCGGGLGICPSVVGERRTGMDQVRELDGRSERADRRGYGRRVL